MEGLRHRASIHDHPNHRIQIPQNISGRNTQDLDTLPRQPVVTRFITMGTIAAIMRFPINLDRQSGRHAGEVNHVRPKSVLASKF